MASRDDDRQSDLAVMDREPFKNMTRLEDILEVVRQVRIRRNEAWKEFVRGEISHDGKNITVQLAVKDAIDNSYNLIHDYVQDDDTGTEYWARTNAESPLGKIPLETRDDRIVWGLKDYVNLPEIIPEEHTRVVKPRNMPSRVETETLEHTVPEEISHKAYLMLKRFLSNEYDLEIQFEDRDDSLESFGFETVDVSDMDIQDIEEIRELVEGGIDARAMTNGGDDTDE
jgi:hypothetical protein